eukprot:TRINITY_DN9968_c0_g1_i1.p1 TRINITY_DN9968_c0_g1~~TRINITY_DN9968_c0_g1_i1.p1  ORF type:complete len:129 (-),score=4.23 TRINITY_DN9968_c0_g1_i1:111-497(-)
MCIRDSLNIICYKICESVSILKEAKDQERDQLLDKSTLNYSKKDQTALSSRLAESSSGFFNDTSYQSYHEIFSKPKFFTSLKQLELSTEHIRRLADRRIIYTNDKLLNTNADVKITSPSMMHFRSTEV